MELRRQLCLGLLVVVVALSTGALSTRVLKEKRHAGEPDILAYSVRTRRQTGVGTTGTEPASLSPWSPAYWWGQARFDEFMHVVFGAIGSDPLVCKTTDDDVFDTGLCMRVADCPYYGGESYGGCGAGVGTCCVFTEGCTGTTSMIVSHFVSRTFTTTSPGTGECKLTVNPRHNNICQYRLDFESFNIASPDMSSDCTQDFFGVTGGSAVPKICGDMTGQHIYVNVEPGGGPIILTMDTSKTLFMKRDWNVKITQIDCNSPYRAPAGCLQFFNETSGLVKSFNFKALDPPTQDEGVASIRGRPQPLISQSKKRDSILLSKEDVQKLKNETMKSQNIIPNSSNDVKTSTFINANDRTSRQKISSTDSRQIQNLNYGVCVNAKVGYCDVTWTQSQTHGSYSFTVTGDASVAAEQLASDFGVENCVTDYVTIPGGKFADATGAEIPAVRFCGNKFPEVKTKAQPYILHVVTDGNEEGDARNLGFALNFRQNLC